MDRGGHNAGVDSQPEEDEEDEQLQEGGRGGNNSCMVEHMTKLKRFAISHYQACKLKFRLRELTSFL